MQRNSNKKIGIFGLGISGISAAKHYLDQELICYDDNKATLQKFTQQFPDISIIRIENNRWNSLDEIIISPGISAEHKIYKIAQNHNIRITSDIEIFLNEINKINPNATIVGVTGTNGKSTVVSLIQHILIANNIKSYLGGNIGTPALDLPKDGEVYVLELSSFQLDLLRNLNIDISVLLNISPDHLDRYNNLEAYTKSKTKILEHENIKIIGISNKITSKIYQELKKSAEQNLIGFSRENITTEKNVITIGNISLKDEFFDEGCYKFQGGQSLQGPHNLENIAAAFAVCRAIGLPASKILGNLTDFESLPHRLKFIGSKNKINFYNDSKGTNTDATRLAIKSFKNIHLLAGGIFKEKTFDLSKDEISNISCIYLYGRDRGKLNELLLRNNIDKNKVLQFLTLNEAFDFAYNSCNMSGLEANILLSPACSSFDQFNNYIDRGDYFTKLVNEKINGN